MAARASGRAVSPMGSPSPSLRLPANCSGRSWSIPSCCTRSRRSWRRWNSPSRSWIALHQTILRWYGESGHLDRDGLRNHLSRDRFCRVGRAAGGPGSANRMVLPGGTAKGAVLEGWRSASLSIVGLPSDGPIAHAASAAMAEQRADAGAHVLAVNRLINPVAAARRRDLPATSGASRDLGDDGRSPGARRLPAPGRDGAPGAAPSRDHGAERNGRMAKTLSRLRLRRSSRRRARAWRTAQPRS